VLGMGSTLLNDLRRRNDESSCNYDQSNGFGVEPIAMLNFELTAANESA